MKSVAVAVVSAAILATGCGGGASTGPRSTSCGPIVTELLEPNEGHLLAGSGATPTYRTHPPTSGPHIAGLTVSGIQTGSVPEITQVSTLETGSVILQYRAAATDLGLELAGLAGPSVVVAPADTLDSVLIATGWATSMRCDRFDGAAIDHFIATVSGRYEGHATTTSAPGTSAPGTSVPGTSVPGMVAPNDAKGQQ